MKVLIVMISVIMSLTANACRVYTDEQYQILHDAYSFGHEYNYGYTIAAIARKESFVGDKVIRINPSDPSYGVMHVQIDTALSLLPKNMNYWEKLEYVEESITDDSKSFDLAVKKLQSVDAESFWYKWKGYNGDGERATSYANDIREIVSEFQECKMFDSLKV